MRIFHRPIFFVIFLILIYCFKVPSSYSSTLGLYQCIAKNNFGEQEFSIEFLRPGLPDPPNELHVMNITYSSFVLNWKPGYNGGSKQIFHIIIKSNHTENKYTNISSIKFEDLNENTRYIIKIRSKNDHGYSAYSTNLIVQTKESTIKFEEFPILHQVYYSKDNHRIYFQLIPRLISINYLCIQYYNDDKISSCIPLQFINNGIEINFEEKNLRLKLCLINQTDICSKSISIPMNIQLINNSSELIFILIG